MRLGFLLNPWKTWFSIGLNNSVWGPGHGRIKPRCEGIVALQSSSWCSHERIEVICNSCFFAHRLQNRHASLYSTCFTEDPWSFQNLCPWIPQWHHCLLSLWRGKEECVQPQSQVALAEIFQLMAAYQSIVRSQGNCFLIKKKWFLLAELARLFATAIPTTPSWYGIVQPSGNWLKQISTCKLEWFKIT